MILRANMPKSSTYHQWLCPPPLLAARGGLDEKALRGQRRQSILRLHHSTFTVSRRHQDGHSAA